MRTIDVPGVGPIQFPNTMSDEQIVQAIERDILPGRAGVTQQAPAPSQMEPVPERGLFGTIGARAADVGGSVVSGAGSVATGLGGLGGVLGLTGYDNVLTRLGRRGAEFGTELMSPELRNQRRALADAMKEAEERGLAAEAGAALSTLASNPSLLFSMAVEQIPAFILSGGVGRAATVVGQIGARGAARAGTVAAERAGQVGAIGTAASLQTGGIADETYREVMGLPEEIITSSPNYQQLLRSMSPSEAREAIANRAAREAATLGGGISVAAMTALPSAEKALFTRGISQSAVRRALGVGGAEAVSEGIEEGGGQFAQNLGIQRQADAERDLLRGVGGAAATGAVLGGVMGAGAGALQRAPLPPSTEPGAGNLTPELRQAIDEYVANREPMTEGQNLLPREMRDIETPVGNLSRSQLMRYMERTLPGMIEQDPGVASLMEAAGSDSERLFVFRSLLAEREQDRIRNLMATGPEAREAFEDVEVQRRSGMRPESVQVLQRDLARAEQQLGQLVEARKDAQARLKKIDSAPVVNAVAREGVQAEINQLTQLIAGREQIRRDIAARIPETERQVTARENLLAQAQGAFDVAQARRERREDIALAPGIEVPTETVITQPIGRGRVSTPELATREISQPEDDARAGAAPLTEMRYVLNPQYKNKKLVGGEAVSRIIQSDKPGKVLAYVERRKGNITEEVPVETTMDKLAQVPVRSTARATQEAAGAAVGPEQVAGRAGRGIDPLGQNLQPRRMVDRQGPEASARVTGEAQATPEAEVSEADVRSTKRIEAQNKINRLYLDKLKDFGAQGPLLRNALVQALKDRTMSAQEVYAAFTAADAFAPLLPSGANHRIEFVKELLPTEKLAEAIRRSGGDPTKPLQGLRQRPSSEGLPGIIKISLAPEMLPMLGETVAHEAFHVLQDYYGKFDPQFKKLMDQGFRDGMSISDVDPTIRRKLEQARYPNSDRSYWQTLTGSVPGTLEAREAQAYAFGALADAARRGVPMSGLKPAFARFVNTIKNFFSKLGSKLRGDGFQTVEEVLGRVSRGEARRFDTMASPTARDIATPGPELSARTSSVELREKPLFYAMGVKSARSESFSDGAKKFAGSQPGQARGARAEGAARSDVGRAAREGDREAAGAGAGPRPKQGKATAQRELTEEQAEASARATNTTVPEFTNWWNGGWRGDGVQVGPSVAANPDGSPQDFYHGTQKGFRVFGKSRSGRYGEEEGPFFFSPDPKFSEGYALEAMYAGAGGRDVTTGQRMLPVYLSIQNLFDSANKQQREELLSYVDRGLDDESVDWRDIVNAEERARYERTIAAGKDTEGSAARKSFKLFRTILMDDFSNWYSMETPAAQRYIRESGFDGFTLMEDGARNFAVYNPRQIKSIFNKFETGAATEPEFSARSPLAADPAFAAMRDKLTGKEIDKPNVFADGLRRFVGALPGEKISSALVRTSVNRAAPGWMLDNLSKDKGMTVRNVGRAMEVALNNSGRVQMYLNHGPLAYDPKTGDVSVRDDVPGLIDAIKGKLNVADKREAQAYLVALRERDLRKAGKKGFFNLTDKEMNDIISKAESAHPEWKQMAADIQRINKALLDFAVNTGTLDRTKADQLGSMFYTPFYRQAEGDVKDDSDAVVGPRLSQSLTRVKTAFDVSVKGGENPLGDLFENMIRNADTIMKAGMKNVAMRQAAEALQDVGLGRPAKAREAGKTITYRVNGQDKHFEVDDATLYVALAGAPREFTNGIYQTMANMAAFFRDMVTLAPSFMLANLWRGKIMAYVQEGVPLYTNTFDGLRQALRSSSSYKAIAAQTGFGGYTYGMGERDAAAAFEREIAGLGYGPGGLLRRTFDTLQKASEATEMAERIKLYERMKAQGMTDKEAAFQAYLLAPFSRRGMGDGWLGYTVNWLVPLVPFLNAKIQGMYRLIENEKGDTQKLWTLGLPKQMLLRGLVVMGLSVALFAKSMDEEPERWDNENPDLKFRYDIIYLPNDNRILLPRAFEVGFVFGAIPVFILDAIRRNDSRDLSKALADLGTSTFFFNPIPQAAVPMLGAFTNYDFFRSRSLETAGDASKLPEERVNRSTSAVAKAIGETFGISPIRTQYVLEGYSGTIGSSVLAGFDSILAGFGMIPRKPAGAFGDPMSMPAIAADLTGVSRFYRSDDQSATRFIGDFYKIKEMTDQLVRSQNMATESRDLDRLAELRGDAGLPLRLRPMVNQASTQITEINKRIARIERSDLTSVEKTEALRPLREQRDRVARRVVERARDIGAY
jgi:hypothetical protein